LQALNKENQYWWLQKHVSYTEQIIWKI
jgi:hypothetical protein